MGEVIRAFIALEIPQSAKDGVDGDRQQPRPELPRARWVGVEGQHLTLKFLGEVPPSVLDGLATALAPRVCGLGPITVTIGGAGFFPSNRRPRVAWLGGLAEGVQPVVEAVEEIAHAHGFARERRPWSLHLTQARLDRPWPPDAVNRFLDWGRTLEVEAFVCDEIVLFSSRLQPGGAVYTALERMPLE